MMTVDMKKMNILPTKNQLSIIAAITLALLIVATPLASASSSGDFNYVANPPTVQVTPGTVIPHEVPNCQTGNTAVPTYPIIYCYSPNFIQTTYNFTGAYNNGFDGAGQTIVIVDAYGSPTIANDLAHFDTVFGLATANFQVICPLDCPKVPIGANMPHDVEGWAVETTLDVEWAHVVAPGANIVLAVAPSSSGNAINAVETYVIQNYPGAIISQSFGIPEALIRANNAQVMQAHQNYQAAVTAGITVLASSGDFGATNGFSILNPSFPSSDPYVTGVGGTQGYPNLGNLTTFTGTCPLGPRPGYPTGCTPTGYGGEQVWNEAWDGIAGGGAESLLFGTPSYQSGLGLTSRGTPDVSYNAAVDGGVLVFTSFLGTNTWFVVGGTSAGSPQWAGIFAIVNQARAANSKGPLGFANTALYAIYNNAAEYAHDFHDITVGDNILVGSTLGFSAMTGFDLASGIGSPNVGNLVTDLAAA